MADASLVGRDPVDLFARACQMSYGEQAAITGVLSALQPQLALDLGTYLGGSLAMIAAHCEEVHTFDLASHCPQAFPNVTYHIGDSKTTVPVVLTTLAREQRNIDFVLVDADHSRAGVQADLTNLLQSEAVQSTVLLLHDCANEGVREGARRAIKQADCVAYADFSFVVAPQTERSLMKESWGGLGIVVVDRGSDFWQYGRRILPNVHRPTSSARSLLWHTLRPARGLKRELAYRARPFYRRVAGTRGARPGQKPHSERRGTP